VVIWLPLLATERPKEKPFRRGRTGDRAETSSRTSACSTITFERRSGERCGNIEVVRKQYHFWPAERGFDAWDVDRLIELSRALPVERVRIDSIGEIDTVYWFDGRDELPTIRKVVEHVRLIGGVDLRYPIILGHDGRVMDGMHRIARALLEGRAEIDAVRFTHPVEPDYRNCQPHELPY
jgi:hypothetical protein